MDMQGVSLSTANRTLIKRFLKYKEIQNEAVTKGLLIYEKMRKYLTLFGEATSHT
jgi:hypothetical protein